MCGWGSVGNFRSPVPALRLQGLFLLGFSSHSTGWIKSCLRFRHLFQCFTTSSCVKRSRRRLSISLRVVPVAQHSLNECCYEIIFDFFPLFSPRRFERAVRKRTKHGQMLGREKRFARNTTSSQRRRSCAAKCYWRTCLRSVRGERAKKKRGVSKYHFET